MSRTSLITFPGPSIRIVPVIFNKIISNEGEVLLEYPVETLLDKINNDLWSVIMKVYWNCFPIAIGFAKKNYDGFRQIKQNDYGTINFSRSFAKYYHINKGLYNLDASIKSGSKIYLCTDKPDMGQDIYINDGEIFIGDHCDINFCLTMLDSYTRTSTPIDIIKKIHVGYTYTIRFDFVTLFVPNDISFIK